MVKRSRTAQGVLAERALLADWGIIDDPFARGMLTPSMAALVTVGRRWPGLKSRSVTLAGLAARVLWFDRQVADALSAGVAQVALVGAGYDSRAWRFSRPGVTFFELDQPGTQEDKRARAPGPGPVYVPADVTAADPADPLRDRGFDTARPSLFVLEGLTMYLGEQDVRRVLAQLRQASAPASRLAVDFYPGRAPATATQRRQDRIQRAARVRSGETLRFGLDRPQAAALVADAGWRVQEVAGLGDAVRALVPAQHGLRVDSIDDNKTLVAACAPQREGEPPGR